MDDIAAVDARGQKISYCPFGCGLERLDDYGYCCHLVGFSNDGKQYEPIEPSLTSRNGKMVENGNRQVNGGVRGKNRQLVQKGDKLINPEYEQISDGIRHLARKWVSFRVYRRTKETMRQEEESGVSDSDSFEEITNPQGAE